MLKSSKLFVVPVFVSLVFALNSLSAPASASPAEKAQNTGPCREDVQKFCKDVKPGGGRIVKCLKQHENDLSAACKSHGEEMRSEFKKEFQEAQAACKGDVDKLCKDVKPGEGRIMKCLKEHENDLSAECKAERTKIKEHHKGMKGMHGDHGDHDQQGQ
jgi:hypothetical protein